MNNEKLFDEFVAVAEFKFGIIAPVVQGLFTDPSRTAYYKRVTEKPLAFPDGSKKKLSYKTIEKWVSYYTRFGFEGLMPHPRADKGSTRTLSDEAIQEIYRLKREFPRLNATQIYLHLVEDSFIPATVSVDSVQRFIRRNDLKSARNPNILDRKAFEEDSFGKLWQADTCYFPSIIENGISRKTYCVMIIDDYSRMLVGGEIFYNDNAENFQKVFKDAVASCGIPFKLYVDNGGPYANSQLSMICGSLETVLLHTKVRDGASKGKCERHWRSLKETWLYGLDISSISSLKRFNELLREYMRHYNNSIHSAIKCTPYDRYIQSKSMARLPKSSEWLDECFLNRICRKVRKDATVSIDTLSYDVPMQFIGATVDIRYRPGDMDSAFILFEDKKFPLKLTNKVENCHTRRQNPIDYSMIGDGSNV